MGGQDTRRCTPGEINSIRAPRADGDETEVDDDDFDEPIIIAKPPPLRLEIGRLIEGRLRVIRLLGRGGMSEVYEAQDERAARTVAVKLMLTDQHSDAQIAIFSEARALVGFAHPNVVGFYGVGAIESQPFIEMESAPGGSLAEIVAERGAVPLAEGLDLMLGVADGLAALHAAGTIHRDIKADNVLLTCDGRPVIADFGLAMHADDLPSLPNGIVGTPAYMAPEAILGVTETFEQYASADQYSLAVTAYFALTGTLPFDAATPSGLFYAQMAVEPDPPSTRCQALPAALDAVILRALAKRPADRYASIAEFRAALASVRAGVATPDASTSVVTSRDSGVRPVGAPGLRPTVVAA